MIDIDIHCRRVILNLYDQLLSGINNLLMQNKKEAI